MKTKMPITVKIASLIWLICGSLFFITAVFIASLLLPLMIGCHSYGLGFLYNMPLMLIVLLIAVFSYILMRIGWQTLKGKAKDTFGSGLVSIAYGSLGLLGILFLFLRGTYTLDPHLISSLLLLIAGILALVGRNQYKEWILNNKV